MTGVDAVRAWVRTFVIRLNLCPWAAGADVRYVASPAKDDAERLADLLVAMKTMDEGDTPGTTLVVYEPMPWDDFLDLVAMAEDLLRAEGYEGVYQLAHFHPDYRFEGVEPDDPANRTNRAPAPTLHVLRCDDVAWAVDECGGDTKAVWERNVALMRERY